MFCAPPSALQNDYGSEEAKRVGAELIEKERITGLSPSAQVGGVEGCSATAAGGGVLLLLLRCCRCCCRCHGEVGCANFLS